jgi:hypothetical protein
MTMRLHAVLVLAALLTSCGNKSQNMNSPQMLDMPRVAYEPAANNLAITAAGPRIAYSYTITYAFDKRNVALVQSRQIALCKRLGPQRCLVVKSTLNTLGPRDHIATDEAVLLIDARIAEDINKQLDSLAVSEGATLSNRQVEAEDVTRQFLDTDARVRAKQALAERLLVIIRSGKGKVGELVEAERAYADTQEELDSARAAQANLAQRVAMSRVSITYAFNDMPGRNSPIRTSLAEAGDTLNKSLATLLTATVAVLPWVFAGAIALTLVRWIRRTMGWRWPRRAQSASPAA